MKITPDMVVAVPEEVKGKCTGCVAYDNILCADLPIGCSRGGTIYKLKPEYQQPVQSKSTATISINGGEVVEVELAHYIFEHPNCANWVVIEYNSPEHAEQLRAALEPLVRNER